MEMSESMLYIRKGPTNILKCLKQTETPHDRNK